MPRLRLIAATALLLTALACSGSDDVPSITDVRTGTGPETGATAPPSTLGGDGPLAVVESFEGLTNAHVDEAPTYLQQPPVGGDHFPVWANCGFYDTPIAEGFAVHSMEHGAVWITYRPGNIEDPADLEVLRDLVRGEPYLLVSPWPEDGTLAEALPAPVVLSAWGLQATAESVDDPVVAAFVDAFASGPQSPEPGAPCVGGVGDPSVVAD